MVGLVHFLVLFMIVMTIGSISGAHVNPAVTLALLALRKIRPNDAAVYILVQLAGGVAGALMTKFLLIDDLADQQNVGRRELNLSLLGGDFQGFDRGDASARSSSCGRSSPSRSTRARRVTGPASPSAARWASRCMIFGPLTGAALNPARWFGPALVNGDVFDNTPLIYIFASDRRRGAGGAHVLVPVRRGPARPRGDARDRAQGPAPGRQPAPVGRRDTSVSRRAATGRLFVAEVRRAYGHDACHAIGASTRALDSLRP